MSLDPRTLWPLRQECWGHTWPGRVCFTCVSSRSVFLCSPSPLFLRNQELRDGAGKEEELAVCEKGCKYSRGKHFLPFLCFKMTKPSAGRRAVISIFHPLRI